MILPEHLELISGSNTQIVTINLDSNCFNLFETEPSIVIQPDLSLPYANQNSKGNYWFRHLDGGYQYINSDGTRYYRYSDNSSVFCVPRRDGGLVQYKSPSGVIEKEVNGKGSILLVIKRSNNAGLTLHVYSPLPMGKSQNAIFRKYVLPEVPEQVLPKSSQSPGPSQNSSLSLLDGSG